MDGILARFGSQTAGITKKSKPFESWQQSPVKDWEVTMQMLSIGDLADVAKLSSNSRHLEMSYVSKIYLLAKCIVNINGQIVVTDEDLSSYNSEHNLVGNQQINLFDFKVLHIRKWSEAVVNRLTYMYDEIQDEYLTEHLGSTVNQGVRDAVISGLDLSDITVPPVEKDHIDADGESPKSV